MHFGALSFDSRILFKYVYLLIIFIFTVYRARREKEYARRSWSIWDKSKEFSTAKIEILKTNAFVHIFEKWSKLL